MKNSIIENREKFKGSSMFSSELFNSEKLRNFVVNATIIKGDQEYRCNLSLNINRKRERIKVLDKNFYYIPDENKNSTRNFKEIIKYVDINESKDITYCIKIVNPITQKKIYEENINFWEFTLIEPCKQKEFFAQIFFRLYVYSDPKKELKKLLEN